LEKQGEKAGREMYEAQFLVHFVLATLATWRVTHLLAQEDGPWDAVVRVRAWLGSSIVGQLMDCFKCLSIWIAAPMALYVTRSPVDWLMVWLGLSGAACLLQGFQPEARAEADISPGGEKPHVLWTEENGPEE